MFPRVAALFLLWTAFIHAADIVSGKPPVTAQKPVTDQLHGVSITDNYRWLEDQNSPETRTWINAQKAYTDKFLQALPGREQISQRLGKLLRVDSYQLPEVRGSRQFFVRRPGDKDFNQICLRERSGQEQVLLDANKDGSAAHPKTLLIMGVSENGGTLAYGTREGGEDEVTVKFFDVDTHKDTGETIPRRRYSSFSLLPDTSGFYYGTLTPAGPRMLFHKRGAGASADRVIFGAGYGPEYGISGQVTFDGRWLLVNVERGAGASQTELFAMQLGKDNAPRPLITKLDGVFNADYFNNHLYVTTTWKSPHRRIFSLDPANPAEANWKTIVPEGADTIDSSALVGGKLMVSYLHNVVSQVQLYDLDGKNRRAITLPGIGSMSNATGRADQDDFFFEYQSFAAAPVIYRYKVSTSQQAVWAQPARDQAPSVVAVKQVWYESRDKTRIPMFIIARNNLKLDGSARVLLTAYGGFDISLTPHFSARGAAWVEGGGVLAIPNLRGGGEFGEAWHKAGMREKKQNVFDDFEYAAEYLIQNGYTTRSRLGIEGGSNGGLLMGAAVTQRPELFGAVICMFPLLDMVRFDRFKIAKLWVPEYGTAQEKDQFAYIYKYSPYHHVEKGVKYPPVLFITGDADTRVDPLHARKMAALMQSATGSDHPIFLKYDLTAGHSGGQATAKEIADTTDELAFLTYMLH